MTRYGLKIPVIKPQNFGHTELPADPATAPTPAAALAHRRFVALTAAAVSECARSTASRALIRCSRFRIADPWPSVSSAPISSRTTRSRRPPRPSEKRS